MTKLVSPINLHKWIEENKEKLQPPVCNKEIYQDGEMIVMAVGGPNNRKDYHYNETPEFFYQVKGDMILKIISEGKFVDVNIREGELYLLPAKVPHSPQRFENTVGLVIEMIRPEGAEDACQWYCEACNNLLHTEVFNLEKIDSELPIIFEQYYSNTTNMTCKQCGTIMERP